MRTFIAVELNNELKEKLGQLQSRLKNGSLDVKWVNPKNIHLTLKFLGEAEEEKIAQIKKILDETAIQFKTPMLEISCLGAFPNLKHPRIIWVGVEPEENQKIIKSMVKILEDKLEKLKFPREERAFSAHITIGRLRSSENLGTLKKSLEDNAEFKGGILEVKQIALIQSTLTPNGPIYNTIYAAKLNKIYYLQDDVCVYAGNNII